MITVTFIYHYEEGKKFEFDYYLGTHRKNVAAFLVEMGVGNIVKKSTVTRGKKGGEPNSPPHFNIITQLYFDTEDDMNTYFLIAKDFPSDLDKYSDEKPIVVIGESI